MSIDLGVPRGKEIGRESCSACFLSAFIFDLLVGAPSGCSVLAVRTGGHWYGAFQCWVGLRVCWGERAGAGAGFSPSSFFSLFPRTPRPPEYYQSCESKFKKKHNDVAFDNEYGAEAEGTSRDDQVVPGGFICIDFYDRCQGCQNDDGLSDTSLLMMALET